MLRSLNQDEGFRTRGKGWRHPCSIPTLWVCSAFSPCCCWLAVTLAGLAVEEVVVPLAGYGSGSTSAVRAVSPSGLVPYLEHEGACIWESLAIAEYCAEHAPALWPADRAARAHARSIAGEMHAGFRELRIAMPMNLGRSFPQRGRTEGALADIVRIEAIWAEALAAHGGPFLMGNAFTIPDVMFAPVVARFLTWQPELSAVSLAYMQRCARTR